MDQHDAVAIARNLIRFDTINPPGGERPCLEWLASLLEPAGFEIAWQELGALGPDRANLIARLPATAAPARAPLVFSGHVDTVPLGGARWSVPPHEGLMREGRLYGRGASDMKSGVAALVRAALDLAALGERAADLRLILSAGEETGCEGVLALARAPDLLGAAGAMIVAEPTDNRPLLGHKGALWLRLHHHGVTAHGSAPELGRNAIFLACESVARLRRLDFGVAEHPVMGAPTLNVGTMQAGMNVNSVPDHAAIGVDVRTVAGQSNASARDAVARALGGAGVALRAEGGAPGPDSAEDALGSGRAEPGARASGRAEPGARAASRAEPGAVEIETLTDMEAVFTDPGDPWMAETRALAAAITGMAAGAETARYFTDASVLKAAFAHPPTLIMGPGPAALAHQTDEWCDIEALDACARAFTEIGRRYLA